LTSATGVGGLRVDHGGGTHLAGERQLFAGDVDSDHVEPIAFAYCTAMWPSPPMPEITTVSPGLVSVSFSPF
jgi:hypothetical protein